MDVSRFNGLLSRDVASPVFAVLLHMIRACRHGEMEKAVKTADLET
jgi:hypothetical protein